MKLGSLFDGIGGWLLSAKNNGIQPVWASEIEKFPISVTQKHFPEVAHLGSVLYINGAEIEPVDIITSGSPCQDLSFAGKRAGIKGQRSALFKESTRIVREMRTATGGEFPSFFIWENVTGVLSSHGYRDFCAVLKEISETYIPVPNTKRWGGAEWLEAGAVTSLGEPLMLNFLESPKEEKECFLSQIIERQDVPRKYFLNQKECESLLKRAEVRGLEMPTTLHLSLMNQSFLLQETQ